MKHYITSIVLAFCVSSVWGQVSYADIGELIDQELKKQFNEKTPGVAIGLYHKDQPILVKGYGMANLEYGIPITEETKFHLVSGSKQFTAYAILKLEEEGKLSLSDEVHTFLSDLPRYKHPVTIDQLLTHTAGLRQETNLERVVGYWKRQVMTQARALQLIYSQKELNFEPGEKFNYSNSGYTLLGQVVEKLREKEFSSWMQSNVIEAAGMTESLYSADFGKIIQNKAYPYDQNRSGFYKASGDFYQFYGGTGLYSSVKDIKTWLDFLESAADQKEHWLEKMQTPAILNSGEKIPWGRGLIIEEPAKGLKKIYHTGDNDGYHAWIGRYPGQDLQLVVLTNLDTFSPERVVSMLEAELIKQLNLEVEPVAKIKGDRVEERALLGWYQTEAEALNYLSDLWQVVKRNDELFFSPTNGVTIPLIPKGKREYELKGMPLTVVFKKGDPLRMIISDPLGNQKALKISREESKEEVMDLQEYTGKYFSPELQIGYQILTNDKGQLIIRHNSPFENRRWWDFNLMSVDRDFFITDRSFFKRIRFSRKEGRINGFRMTNQNERVANLWFEKLN